MKKKQTEYNQKYRDKVRAIKADQERYAFLNKYPQWDRVKNLLDPQDREIIEFKHGFVLTEKKASYEDIGEHLNLSRQRIHKIYQRAITRLENQIKALVNSDA